VISGHAGGGDDQRGAVFDQLVAVGVESAFEPRDDRLDQAAGDDLGVDRGGGWGEAVGLVKLERERGDEFCEVLEAVESPPHERLAAEGQEILAEPAWAKRLTDRDKKALNALIWAHINPYGTFHIDMHHHLDLGPSAQNAQAA
jgi:hypothetical protein